MFYYFGTDFKTNLLLEPSLCECEYMHECPSWCGRVCLQYGPTKACIRPKKNKKLNDSLGC